MLFGIHLPGVSKKTNNNLLIHWITWRQFLSQRGRYIYKENHSLKADPIFAGVRQDMTNRFEQVLNIVPA